jgi:folate-dependent phosphoribosylglycinamide formyltransferase PurN
MKICLVARDNRKLFLRTLFLRLHARFGQPTHVLMVDPVRNKSRLGAVWKQGVGRVLKRKLSSVYERFELRGKGDAQTDMRTLSFYDPDFSFLERYADSHCSHSNLSFPELCRQHHVNIVTVESANAQEAINYVLSHRIDLLVNINTEILQEPIIRAPRIGILNPHMAFLPTFRGVDVLEWSLFHHHKVGVTVHFIDPGIDTGDILHFEEVFLERDDDLRSLRGKSFVAAINALLTVIDQFMTDNVRPRRQLPEEGVQYFLMHPRLKQIINERLSKRSGR